MVTCLIPTVPSRRLGVCFLDLFSNRLDIKFKHAHNTLMLHLDRQDMDCYYHLWSEVVEDAVADFCCLKGKQHTAARGRGTDLVQKHNVAIGKTAPGANTHATLAPLPPEQQRLTQQAMRCTQLASRAKCLSKQQQTSQQADNMIEQCNSTVKAIMLNSRTVISQHRAMNNAGVAPEQEAEIVKLLCSLPDDFFSALANRTTDSAHLREVAFLPKLIFKLKAYAMACDKSWQTHFSEAIHLQKLNYQLNKSCKLDTKHLFATAKKPRAAHLHRTVVVDAQGNQTVTSNPREVDQAFIKAWQPVFGGNLSNECIAWQSFQAKYSQHLVQQPEHKLPPTLGPELLLTLKAAKPTAGSLDGWLPADFTFLNESAAHYLALMLNTIEAGAEWPAAAVQARTATLLKKEGATKPLDFRLLSLLSGLYRRWATHRLRQLEDWVLSWAPAESFAGVPGRGAEDCWYLTALDIEEAKLSGHEVSGLVTDIMKCFDQISKHYMEQLLLLAGFPKQVLRAYCSFHDAVLYRNTFAMGLGMLHKRNFGIPQGCPFSMLFVALWTAPWVSLMKSAGARPRTLADDILLMGQGPSHESILVKATNLTMHYFHDAGAKISMPKSKLWSTNRCTRQRLRDKVWDVQNQNISVVITYRDLGTHMSTGTQLVGTTINNRIKEVNQSLNWLQKTNLSYPDRQTLILCKFHPKALYGVEAAPPAVRSIEAYRAHVANACAPHSNRSCDSLVFEMLQDPQHDLDPLTVILQKRVSLLRRVLHKFPQCQSQVHRILGFYQDAHFHGIHGREDKLLALQPAPPPGTPGFASWNSTEARGPMGLLLLQLYTCAAQCSSNLTIHQKGVEPYSILHAPYNHLKLHVQHTCSIARVAAIGRYRTSLAGVQAVNSLALRQALASLDTEQKQWITYHIALGTQSPCQRDKYIPDEVGRCPHCFCEQADFKHLMWHCPIFEQRRFCNDPLLKQLKPEELPLQMLYGLPPVLTVSADSNNTCINLSGTKHVDSTHPAFFAEELADSAKQLYFQQHAMLHGGNGEGDFPAGQVLQHIRGCLHADPFAIFREATFSSEELVSNQPDQVNCWSDGTLQQGASEWSLAGCAAWEPNRSEEGDRLSSLERSLCIVNHNVDSTLR